MTLHHVLHAAEVLKETCQKKPKNVINRKFHVLTLNIEIISLVKQEFVTFSLVLRFRENIKKILSHS